MKKLIFATTTLALLFTATVFATETTTEEDGVMAITEAADGDAEEDVMMIAYSAPRALAYEALVSMDSDDTAVYSITTQTNEGTMTEYQITEDTLFIDAMTGEKCSYKDIDDSMMDVNFYIYFDPEKAESDPMQGVAQAVIMNVPMDATIPKLYVVDAVEMEEDSVALLLDTEGMTLTVSSVSAVTSYEDGTALTVADITAQDRIFVWESTVEDESEDPYQIVVADAITGIESPKVVVTEEAPVEEVVEVEVEVVVEEVVEAPIVSTTVEITMYEGVGYIPLRATADALGLTVDWNAVDSYATIASDMRKMDIAPGQTIFTSAPKDEAMVGMPTPKTLNKAFINSEARLQVDPEVFSVLVGFDVVQDRTAVVISSN
ncbi:MAG: stalk domain-containing protein [Bacillota bacterium]